MSRYIDADALKKSIDDCDICNICPDKDVRCDYDCDFPDCLTPKWETLIDSAPSIDIEPKRGEWKPFDLTWGRSIWYCTACEESTEVPCDLWKHKPIYKYCPNCGADMRKGADDE